MTEDFNPSMQHEVQRQLGRCLLRLQQYERLMKSMLSRHRLGGPVPGGHSKCSTYGHPNCSTLATVI
jgi:hypothetical protein